MFAAITDTATRFALGTLGAVVAAGICLGAAAAPAAAQTATAHTVAVSYKDLDLSKAQGRHALQGRIKAAARSVCDTGSNDLQSLTEENRCLRAAIGNAQSKAYAAIAAANAG